jgi:hypothetical protein
MQDRHKTNHHGHQRPGPREDTSLLVFIRRRGSFAKARSLHSAKWGLLGIAGVLGARGMNRFRRGDIICQ